MHHAPSPCRHELGAWYKQAEGFARPAVSHLQALSHTSFKRDAEEFLGFDGKFHREFVDDFLGISVDDEVDSGLCGDATLVTIEELVFRDFRRGGVVFHNGIGVVDVNVGERVRTARAAQQK